MILAPGSGGQLASSGSAMLAIPRVARVRALRRAPLRLLVDAVRSRHCWLRSAGCLVVAAALVASRRLPLPAAHDGRQQRVVASWACRGMQQARARKNKREMEMVFARRTALGTCQLRRIRACTSVWYCCMSMMNSRGYVV